MRFTFIAISSPTLIVATFVGPIAPALGAEQTPYEIINAEAAKSVIHVQRLRGGLSVLSGSGGNITMFTGRDGVFFVDSGIAVSRRAVDSAVRGLGGRRYRYVVDTHWHWDHTDGNGWMKAKGAVLAAHPNTIKHLGSTIRVEEWGHTFTPVARSERPVIAIPQRKVFRFNGTTIDVRAYPQGHTDGDLFVYFPTANVLATGDSFWNGLYPFIDYKAGGSINGMISETNATLRVANDRTIIVPGHGPVARRRDLIAYRNMLVDIRDRVAKLKARRKSVDQVIAAKPTAPYDSRWGTSLISPALFTRLVYRGVD